MHCSCPTHSRKLAPYLAAFALLLASGIAFPSTADAGDHSLGIGAHFWRTVDDLIDDSFDGIEDDGFAYVLSYQYIPRGLFRLELDVEYYADGFGGSDDTAFSPIVYVLAGHSLYAGVGLGVTYADSFQDDVSDPFYLARIGFNFDLLPGLSIDLNANYRAGAFDDLDEADTDAITLGAIARFNI